MKKKPLVVLTGPTAVGKTKASIGLAKAIGGEIISADSMQVYEYMDIGSAKIRPEEMQGVPHYLIDDLKPWDEFHVVRFQQMAKNAMEQIYANGHIPIVVGGTGFYIQALLYDIDFTENNADTAYREELEALAKTQGAEYLHEMLEKVDPESAEQIHFHNVKRVIRALEYYQQTGKSASATAWSRSVSPSIRSRTSCAKSARSEKSFPQNSKKDSSRKKAVLFLIPFGSAKFQQG